jgi:hypothetical protein
VIRQSNNYLGISPLINRLQNFTKHSSGQVNSYVNEIVGDHQCGFCHNRSTIYQIFYICQILEKKWKYNGTVHQLLIDFKIAYGSVKREFGIPKKLFRLIKMYLNETYSKVHVGKLLSDTFPIKNGLKQGDALSPLLFNFGLELAIRKVQEDQVSLELNGTYQPMI